MKELKSSQIFFFAMQLNVERGRVTHTEKKKKAMLNIEDNSNHLGPLLNLRLSFGIF